MKTRIFQVVRPSPLTWLFIALLILAQVSFCARTDFYPSRSTTQIGIGYPVAVSYREGADPNVHIRWAALAINLIACYLLSAVAVAMLKAVTGLHRPFPIYGGAVLGILCLAFLISIGVSRAYWGYFFRRQPVLTELDDVTRVTSVVPVTTEQTPAGEYRLVVNTDASIADQIAYARDDPYYSLDERVLVYLEDRHLLPDQVTLSPDTDLYDLLPETGLLAESQDGYNSAASLQGVVIDAHTESGSQLVFLSATGGQVSNDHYPCYEMVFEKHPQSGQLTFVRGQRFFFDVAGMEGAEWYVIWLLISLMGTMLALPTVTTVAVIRNAILSKRTTAQPELSV